MGIASCPVTCPCCGNPETFSASSYMRHEVEACGDCGYRARAEPVRDPGSTEPPRWVWTVAPGADSWYVVHDTVRAGPLQDEAAEQRLRERVRQAFAADAPAELVPERPACVVIVRAGAQPRSIVREYLVGSAQDDPWGESGPPPSWTALLASGQGDPARGASWEEAAGPVDTRRLAWFVRQEAELEEAKREAQRYDEEERERRRQGRQHGAAAGA